MGKVTKKPMPIWAKMGHARPTTRREFLGYGIIPFAARALVPGALGLLTSRMANAAVCANGAAGVPFITLNLSGGAGLSSNYMPLDAGGGPLPSYSKMGNGSGGNIPARIAEFGVPHFSANSQFIVGVRNTASAAARDRTAFVAGCVQSRDDSPENAFDVSGMAYKGGLVGAALPNMGTRSTPTGLNQKPALLAPPPPLVVSRVGNIQNAIGYTAALQSNLNASQRSKIAKLASDLTGIQSRRLASISTAAHVQSLVECAGIKNTGLISGGGNDINPLADTAVGNQIGTLYGINNGTADGNEQRVFATMIYNAIKGNAGTVSLEMGGYDYHDGSRATGDNRDRAAGEACGRILQMAHLMQKSVFIYICSDGAVVSSDSANAGSPWVSDRGSAGMLFMLAYHPAGRPATGGFQIGHYNAGQVADESSAIGNSPEVAAQAVYANYAKFAYGPNWESILRRVIPRGGALDTNLGSVIKFG